MEWKEVCKSIIRSNIAVAEDNHKLYSLLLEQCSRALRSKLEGSTGYKKVESDQDGIALVDMIRQIMCGAQDHQVLAMSAATMFKQFFCFTQHDGQGNAEYMKGVDANVSCKRLKFTCHVYKMK